MYNRVQNMVEGGIDAKIPSSQPLKSPGDGVIKITEADLSASAKPDIVITDTDLTPEIQITTADLPVEPPLVQINRRDLARNKLEWSTGAAKDLLQSFRGKGKKLAEQVGWWGKDRQGTVKKAKFDDIQIHIQEIDDLADRIQIIPDNLHEKLTDIQLSDIEIKILDDGKETITTSDNEELRIDIGETQDIRHEIAELSNQQKSAVQDLWGSRTDFTTPIVMEQHIQQSYRGQEGIWSCAVASSLNALHALGVAQHGDTENSLINEMGGKTIFGRDGGLPMGHVQELMQKRGLISRPSSNLVELIQTLENGGVAVVCRTAQAGAMGHAVLISGAETQNGQVYFRVNDPLGSNKLSRESAIPLADQLNYLSSLANMYLIEDPKNLQDVTILE